MKKPLLLAILDGYGVAPSSEKNAITTADTPNLDKMYKENPYTLLSASGLDVGLPDGQMGNSEVGHTNIGAGRVVYQGLTMISKSIVDGDFFDKEEFLDAIENCKANNSVLHIMGLASNGGVHSHLSHMYALLELAKKNDLKKVYIHCFTDGRDVDMKSALGTIAEIKSKIKEIGIGKIATVIGRYYAMDRDNRWERVKKAYDALVAGCGIVSEDIEHAINMSYEKNITDEFFDPIICTPDAEIRENDSIIFFNFRPDRAREITRAFTDPDFSGFERKNGYFKIHFVCMTQYDKQMPNVSVAFKPQNLENTLGEYLSKNGRTQLRIAETEKYAHVTFFFNGGVETIYDGETRILVPSPKVATYDMQPEMSADEVTDKALEAIGSGTFDVIVLNYANCDMVGHTGVFDATVKAVETVDKNIGKVVSKVLQMSGIAIITADHGNADEMIKDDHSPMTAHTTNKVPFILVGKNCNLKSSGRLADIAPTILDILNIKKPSEMKGESLIED